MLAVAQRGFQAIHTAKAAVLRRAPAQFASTLIEGLCRRNHVLGNKGVEYGDRYQLGYEARVNSVSSLPSIDQRRPNLIGVNVVAEGEASCSEEYNEDAAAIGSAIHFVLGYVPSVAKLFRSVTVCGAQNSPFDRAIAKPDISVKDMSRLIADLTKNAHLTFGETEVKGFLDDAHVAFAAYTRNVMDSLIAAAATGFSDSEESAWSHTAALTGYGVLSGKDALFGLKYTVLGIGRSDEDRDGDVAAMSDESHNLCRLLVKGLESMTLSLVLLQKPEPSGLSGFSHVIDVDTLLGSK
ncbi:MAG: hypothetical protein WC527_00630 [Candidatus Margulisiibacteriota bacterium]